MLYERKKTHDYSIDVNQNRNFVITDHKTGSSREIPYTEFIGNLKSVNEIQEFIASYLHEDSLVFYTFEAKYYIAVLAKFNCQQH